MRLLTIILLILIGSAGAENVDLVTLPGRDSVQLTIYNSADINVDVNRIYQLDVVPVRVYDVLACGGFLIAEHSDALLELFEPGTHLETWKTIAELRDKVAHYLAHPTIAQRIAGQGLAKVRDVHTIPQRVRTMIAALGHPSVANRFVV